MRSKEIEYFASDGSVDCFLRPLDIDENRDGRTTNFDGALVNGDGATWEWAAQTARETYARELDIDRPAEGRATAFGWRSFTRIDL